MSPTMVWKERYEIERPLGRGGMSAVYLARDRQLLSKRVVLKVLLEEMSDDEWVRQKFQQEMEALARIDHPGVVGVLDTGQTPEGKQFLVMQYVDGETLRQVLDQGPMDFARGAAIVRQVGQALAAAHEKGVWHRDLKPENIMLQRSGGEDYVKLIDFGIAGIQNSQFAGAATKVAGTLTYMAPEQFVGNPCAASDTYALGVVAYEMLTGKKPFSADSMAHLVQEQRTWELPRKLRPDVPEAAESAVLKALSFRPEARQPSVREFAEEFASALANPAARTREFEAAEDASEPAAKAGKTPVIAAVAAILVLAAAGAGWFATHSKPKTEPLQVSYHMIRYGSHISFDVGAAQPGYLYILNYGQEAPGSPKWTVNLLHPLKSASAASKGGETLRIPQSGYFAANTADNQNRPFIVFARQPVKSLEDLKMLPQDSSGIATLDDPARAGALIKDLTAPHPDDQMVVREVPLEVK
jgi:serine/threonine protein kinase